MDTYKYRYQEIKSFLTRSCRLDGTLGLLGISYEEDDDVYKNLTMILNNLCGQITSQDEAQEVELSKPSQEVCEWPEYKALRKRLGIPDVKGEMSCTIRVALDEIVSVIQEYLCTKED